MNLVVHYFSDNSKFPRFSPTCFFRRKVRELWIDNNQGDNRHATSNHLNLLGHKTFVPLNCTNLGPETFAEDPDHVESWGLKDSIFLSSVSFLRICVSYAVEKSVRPSKKPNGSSLWNSINSSDWENTTRPGDNALTVWKEMSKNSKLQKIKRSLFDRELISKVLKELFLMCCVAFSY